MNPYPTVSGNDTGALNDPLIKFYTQPKVLGIVGAGALVGQVAFKKPVMGALVTAGALYALLKVGSPLGT